MGNTMSEDDEAKFLEEAKILEGTYEMSLDNPDVDKRVNDGTSAANCQPKHTILDPSFSSDEEDEEEEEDGGHGLEVVASDGRVSIAASSPNTNSVKEKSGGQSRKVKRSRKNKSKNSVQGNSSIHDGNTSKDKEKKLTYVQMVKLGYQELVNAIIRPPRADYKVEALGPPAFSFCGRRFTRTDFALNTKRGHALQCSHWEPVERTSDRIPCVIYMHGNSSARVEVIPQLSYLLCLGLAVFSFDFAGSGKSDGDHVSLGYYEREDLMCVVAHLRATNVVSTIALWGRSMGAATALMHGDRDPSIACMILDSPFADLTQLAEEMCEKGREQGINVPNFVVSVAIRMIRSSVKRQANFDIKHISPIAHADKCFIPALFVAGEHDDFINKRHSEAIHAKYAGDKNLIVVEGDHNSPRPKFMFDSVSIFLQTCLQIPNSWSLRVHPGMNLMAPPWFFPGAVGPSVTSPRKSSHYRRSPAPRPTGKSEQEMGMTLERQREIQASLFRMLGQADDPPMTSADTEDENGVGHATTFPPRPSSSRSASETSDGKMSSRDL